MRHCANCDVDVRGDWDVCPLCRQALDTSSAPPSRAAAHLPLRFNRNRIRRILLWASLLVIVVSMGLQRLVFPEQPMTALRWVWFGLASMWVVVIIIVRKRRNIAKNVSYLLVVTSGLCAYADHLGGWRGWSTTIVIPVMCIFAIVGILIAVRVVRLHVGDYILYAALSALIRTVPRPVPDLRLGLQPDPLGDQRRGGGHHAGAGAGVPAGRGQTRTEQGWICRECCCRELPGAGSVWPAR